MIINVKQGTKDTKEDYLNLLDELEVQGFKVFNICCYDARRKLSEATMIKDDKASDTYPVAVCSNVN